MSCAMGLLLSGRLDGWLAGYELRMVQVMGERWLEEYTAKELCRNATMRERMHTRMQLHYMRYRWQYVEREKRLLDALSQRFGFEAAA